MERSYLFYEVLHCRRILIINSIVPITGLSDWPYLDRMDLSR